MLSANNLQLPPRLRGVSIELLPGEATGLLGINGAGKSSVLSALAGVLPLHSGEVYYQGQPLHAHPGLRRFIGWLPQHAPLYEDMTVLENLRFKSLLHHTSNRKLQQTIEQFDLGDLQYRLVRKLSGGERMRLGLACCLLHGPQALLLDEPTAGLDPLQAEQLRQLIGSLASQRTVLIATHLLDDVESLCQRVLLLEDGRIVADELAKPAQKLMLAEFSVPPDDASLLRVAGVERIHYRDGHQVVLQLNADAVPHMAEKLACHGWGLRLWQPSSNPLLERFRTSTHNPSGDVAP